MLGTPLAIELLLHSYVTSEPIPNREAPAVKDTLQFLHRNGLIDRTDFPRATEKGEFLIKHLCSVPFPVQVWVMPEPEGP